MEAIPPMFSCSQARALRMEHLMERRTHSCLTAPIAPGMMAGLPCTTAACRRQNRHIPNTRLRIRHILSKLVPTALSLPTLPSRACLSMLRCIESSTTLARLRLDRRGCGSGRMSARQRSRQQKSRVGAWRTCVIVVLQPRLLLVMSHIAGTHRRLTVSTSAEWRTIVASRSSAALRRCVGPRNSATETRATIHQKLLTIPSLTQFRLTCRPCSKALPRCRISCMTDLDLSKGRVLRNTHQLRKKGGLTILLLLTPL